MSWGCFCVDLEGGRVRTGLWLWWTREKRECVAHCERTGFRRVNVVYFVIRFDELRRIIIVAVVEVREVVSWRFVSVCEKWTRKQENRK